MKIFMKESLVFVGVQLVIALQWLLAGIEKAADSGFRDGLEKTLGAFASKNPYAWYTSLLTDAFIPNAAGYAQAVSISEICIGIGLLIALAATLTPKIPRAIAASAGIASLVVGLFLNANFYFAAGWTGPSTAGLNVLMFWIQAICLAAWILWLRERPLRR